MKPRPQIQKHKKPAKAKTKASEAPGTAPTPSPLPLPTTKLEQEQKRQAATRHLPPAPSPHQAGTDGADAGTGGADSDGLNASFDPEWFDKLPTNLQRELHKMGFGKYDPHPQIHGRLKGNGNMSEAELIEWVTDPAVMRYQGYSEQEIQRIKNDVQEREFAVEIEASANYSGDATKGSRKRALDYLVQDFLRAHHAGFRLPKPHWFHKTAPGVPFHEMTSRWRHPKCNLIEEICAAILRGDSKVLRTLSEVVGEMQSRLSGEGDSFDVKPVRAGKRALIDARKKTGEFPTSASDLRKHIQDSTGDRMSERYIAEQKRKLGFKRARPGRPPKTKF